MHQLLTWVVEPGFFASAPVRTALLTGGIVAVVSAVVGLFTVMRGQSFAGHALGDVAAAGGAGALLLGLSPLAGFIGLGIAGAGVMDLIGVRRVRGRDLATGIVLGAAIGLTALFLYLDTTASATTGPAATALRLTHRMGTALIVACLTGLAATWAGILLAYDSYYWGTGHQSLPVSFFIVAVVFAAYLLTGLP